MSVTTIEWTDRTWSPLRVRVKSNAAAIAASNGYTSLINIGEKMAGRVGQHCEPVSGGCKLCYSGTWQARCLKVNGTGLPFDRSSRDLVDPFIDEKILVEPLKWKQPKRIFVENQSDLFGEWYTDEQIDRVFAVMALCPQHTFQVLTKRPERMRKYLSGEHESRDGEITTARGECSLVFGRPGRFFPSVKSLPLNQYERMPWPLPNVWLGVSVEDQATADARIPLLLQTLAAKRFVSYEPALGPVDFSSACDGTRDFLSGREFENLGPWETDDPGLDLVIVGGESGNGARPFNITWARNTIAQCKAANVACFVKQMGRVPIDTNYRHWGHRMRIGEGNAEYNKYIRVTLKNKKGGDMSEWPADLRVREFPV